MEEFQHDKYTLTALKLVRLGRSFFITGKAGTGKTTLLREIVRECRARGKNIVVAAPTGVAAKNAEGQTLHSLFGLKTIVFIPGKVKRWNRPLDKAKVNVIKNLEILIIDEVSMVRCDVMDMVDLTLQHYKGNKKPFGGIQVILFGDLFQLPPVVGDDEDKELLYSYYEKDNSFFFSSDVIRKNPFPVLELSKVYRQQDQKFVKILNHIREGVYLESDRNEINMRLKIGYEPSEDDSAVYLRTINWKVGRYNYSKLRKLSNELYIFNAIKKGNFPKNLYPTDDPLKLKVGARVMLLRNDNDGLRYVNGTLGFITSINSKYIRVLTDEGEAITVEQALWKLYKYEWDEKKKSIIPVEYASFKQFPLKMAWAVTIHKSQGMTFDKVIVDAHNSFDSGQVYVALSRCRTLDGITLTSKISKNDIKINPKVIEYMESVTRIDPSEIEESDISEQQTFILSKNGKTVKGIISEAYGKIVIPDGVEKIEDNAFKDNTRITDVVCPKSLRVIGDRVFSGCINLRTIQLNEGLVSIGTGAFFHTGLESVYLPSTLELLNFYPFECKMNVLQPSDHFYSDAAGVLYSADRKSLVLFPRKVDKKVIKVPDRITCIKYFAFIECSAMEIVIPEGIKKLEGYPKIRKKSR